MKDNELSLLLPRMRDLSLVAGKSGFAAGDFLSPAEQAYLESALKSQPIEHPLTFWGGYGEAERKVPIFTSEAYRQRQRAAKENAPPPEIDWDSIDWEKDDWWQQMPDGSDDLPKEETPAQRCAEVGIAILRFDVPKGAPTPGHRDFLGSLLALGLERRVIGDIVPFRGAFYVFVKETIAPYLLQSLDRVGKSPVVIVQTELPIDFAPEREMQRMDLTVASLRSDAIVAAIVGCSREEAKNAVIKGLFFRNHLPFYEPESPLVPGDLISVKGQGRFRLEAVAGQTKKGRLKIVLQKYV